MSREAGERLNVCGNRPEVCGNAYMYNRRRFGPVAPKRNASFEAFQSILVIGRITRTGSRDVASRLAADGEHQPFEP